MASGRTTARLGDLAVVGELASGGSIDGGNTMPLWYEALVGNEISSGHQVHVDRHTDDGIDSDGVEGVDLFLTPNASGSDQAARSSMAQVFDHIERDPLKESFSIDIGVQECAAEPLERSHHIRCSDRGGFLPAFDGDIATARIDGENELVAAEVFREFAGEGDMNGAA